MNRIKRHPWLSSIIAVIVLLGLTLGIWFAAGAAKVMNAPAAQATRAAGQSQVSQTLQRLKPQGRVITSAVAPANAQWWKFMTAFAPMWQLPKWNELTGGPTSVGAAILNTSKSGEDSFPNYFGTPTIYLNYPSATAAKAGMKQFIGAGDAATTYQAFTSGTTLIVLPTGAFSDQIFANSKKAVSDASSAANDSQLTRGSWQINWSQIDAYFKQSTAEKNYGAYAKALEALGYDAKTNGSWAGYSTDGTHWTGSNFSTSSAPTWDPKKLNYPQFAEILNSTSIITGADGTKRSGSPTKADDPNYTQYSTYVPQQALMLEYFGAATSTKAFGGVRDMKTQKLAVPTKASQSGEARVVFNPSAWFGIMRYPDANGFYQTVGFSTWTFDLLDSTNLNITVSY